MKQEVIKYLFDYNYETGIFTWKVRRNKAIAGSLTKLGYCQIGVFKKKYKAHRLAWIYMYGDIPSEYQIDHINRIKNDNRIFNLRLATIKKNNNNKNIRLDNTSGYTGVYWDKERNKWKAQCQIDGKVKPLGRFNNAHEAYEAYKQYLQQVVLLQNPNHFGELQWQ